MSFIMTITTADRMEFPFEQRVTVNYDHPDSLETELLVEHLKQSEGRKIHRVPGL